MQEDEIRRLIERGLPAARVEVSGDGRHFNAVVVSAEFSGKSPLARHRRVYAALGDSFERDAVHALSIKTYTPEEWHKVQR